jgi:tocopherol O-methyltransferase
MLPHSAAVTCHPHAHGSRIASAGVWERTWGEHMHHGYYGRSGGERKDHRQAQIDMIDETLAWAGVDGSEPPAHVLDVGCGIGGSSRHIARKYGNSGVGITLSPVQAQRANALSAAQNLGDRLEFKVADALQMPFEDNSFDLVWSMESGEHMPDKRQFVSELARVCKPGGRVIVVAWCHRDLEAGEEALSPREERLLGRINQAYYLPRWCSAADYKRLATDFGLVNVQTDDWTQSVRRFWPAVILSSLRPRAFIGMLRSGMSTLRGALVMPLMIRGQKKGLIKFAMVSMRKP